MKYIGIKNRSGFLRKMALNGICIVVNVKEMKKATYLLSVINQGKDYANKIREIIED